MLVDKKIQAVLDDYHQRAAREREVMEALSSAQFDQRIDEFLLPLGPAAGSVLNLLARGANARRVLEVGTSYGYSTIWMAAAVRETGGRVISLDLQPAKQAYARSALERAGLAAQVEFVAGDALETIARCDGPFDFVLIDLWKRFYVPVFDLVHPRLARGGFVAADNMTFPAGTRARARAYQRHVRSYPDMDSVLLPVGSGIELSRRTARVAGKKKPRSRAAR
ncbi:MAG: O-methyltransferase [Gammaproteobacteria bacterium]|nr:O-methyltransferase [Gammaproteobacteria bacterium]